MEEYLQNMKALRFQMNDVEDQAAKISVDEQTQITSIHAVEVDLESEKAKTRSLKEETELMVKAKNELCSQILEKHKKIASLEAESSGLSQTLELIQQEQVGLSSKHKEKRAYYIMVVENLRAQLQGQQDWINSHNLRTDLGDLGSVQNEGKTDDKRDRIKGNSIAKIHPITENMDYETDTSYKSLITELDSGRAKLAEMKENNSKLASDRNKMEQSIKQLQCGINDFPPELRAMDVNALEEEHKALLSDKAGEKEYLQTLQCQVEQLKGISQVIKCACGEEYQVEMVTCS